MNSYMSIEELKEKARWLRCTSLKMISYAGSGHPGGSLSEVEILTVLYYTQMNIDPKNPGWEDRDRFILSKGHCCPPLYAVLADKGYFDIEHLWTLRKFGSILQGHPNIITPGIDSVSGSLGNGLSVGVGMCMAGRAHKKNYNVYVLLGDGELQEGCVWEAAMCAAQHRIGRLTAIVDYNNLQINGTIDSIVGIEPLADKWRDFGWNVSEVNGHDIKELTDAFQDCSKSENPSVIIAHTVKGKGVSYMENMPKWHGSAISDEELTAALRELGEVSE